MFFKIRQGSLVPRWLAAATLATIILIGSGITCNALVMLSNGAKMPVAMQEKDILFVIGPAKFGVIFFPSINNFDERHQALTEQTRFRILADRIPISFRSIPLQRLPKWCSIILEKLVPAGQEGIASIGDLFIGVGIILALPTLLLLSLRIMWEISLKILKRF